MFDVAMWLIKIGLVLFWSASILSLTPVMPDPWARLILWLAGLALAAHVVEYLFVRSRVAERNDGNSGFAQTMIFGLGYWLPILKRRT